MAYDDEEELTDEQIAEREREAAAEQAPADEGPDQSPWAQFGRTQPTMTSDQAAPVSTLFPDQEQTVSTEADLVGPQGPQVPAPGAYNGSAAPAPPSFPGLPVLVEHNGFEGDNVTYNGQIMPSLEAAYAARSQHAANPQAQAAYAQAQQQQQAPQQTAQLDPSQMNSIQLQREYDRHQLSGPQRLEMNQLQNGIARLQADAREGRIPTSQAIALGQQLQSRLQPMMMTIEQAHGIQTALQIAHVREQVAHAQINNTRARAYDAAHGLTAQSSVKDSAGNEIGVLIRNSDGSTHFAQIHREPVARPQAAPRATGSGTARDMFDAAYNAADKAHADAITNAQNPEEAARLRTPEGRNQFINNHIGARYESHRLFAGDNAVQQSRFAGGPVPFDAPTQSEVAQESGGQPVISRNLSPQRFVEVALHLGIKHAMDNGAPERETRLRDVANALRNNGGDTGRLSDEQQRALQQTGHYYRGSFTPQNDRAITQATISRVPRQMPNGITETTYVQDPRQVQAANEFRRLVMNYGGRPNESDHEQQTRFDELRGRLGFSAWPPPRPALIERPAIPPVNAPVTRDPNTPIGAAANPLGPEFYNPGFMS